MKRLHEQEGNAMTIARISAFTGVIAALAALAACQTAGPGGGGGPAPSGVDGQWLSADGVATSTFSAGTFTTTANDTGNKLAEGTYVVSGASVSISGTSVIRQTPIAFNCLLASPKQMNCTSSAGQQFSLIRRA
jgi:hypothetical protein